MSIKHFAVLAVAVASMNSAAATAQSPPLEVKGVPLGASKAELQAKIPGFDCRPSGCRLLVSSYARSECGSPRKAKAGCLNRVWAATDFGPARVKYYEAEFRDEKLGKMLVRVDEATIGAILIDLKAKYGAPTSDTVKSNENGASAMFEDHIVAWERPDGSITVHQRFDNTHDGAVIMSTRAFDETPNKQVVDKTKAQSKSR